MEAVIIVAILLAGALGYAYGQYHGYKAALEDCEGDEA